MTWASWLWGLALPLVKRVLAGLGFGVVTYAGASAVLDQVWGYMQTALGGLLTEVSAVLAIAGFFEALSIMAGGIVAGVGMMALKRLSLL